jgi:hypothetical protein
MYVRVSWFNIVDFDALAEEQSKTMSPALLISLLLGLQYRYIENQGAETLNQRRFKQ